MRKFIIALIAVVGMLACVQTAEAGPLRRIGGAVVHGAARVGKAVVGRERRQARRANGSGLLRGRLRGGGC